MSDVAELLIDQEKQYVVLVIGKIDDEQRTLLLEKIEYASSLFASPITSISVDVDGYLMGCRAHLHGDDRKTLLVQYLKQLTGVLAQRVRVSRIYSSDLRSFVKEAVREVFPQSVYDVLEPVDSTPREGFDRVSIRELGLESRVRNCLMDYGGIRTVGELVGKTDRDLLMIPNFGPGALANVLSKLAERDLALSEEDSGRCSC